MAAFIKNEVTTELNRIKEIFTFQEIPDKVFRGVYNCYLYTSFYFFLSEGFFEGVLKKFRSQVGDIRFASLDPSPDYFYTNFGEYPILTFDQSDNFESFISLLNKVPKGGNIADALLNHQTSICFYQSNENAFAVYAQRDYDIAIVAFNDVTLKEEFTSLINSKFMFDRTAALEIMSMGFENRVLPRDIKESFEMNYPLS